ncbi:MAG: endonuclease MutS2 [Spirochaetales bacterium]|nr:endonuclease MutS2 [Spirochaetales bacterium]
MDKHTLDILEFPKIQEELCEYALSESGKELIFQQTISSETEVVRENLKITSSFRHLLERSGNLPALDFPDITHYFKVLKIQGASLETHDLAMISIFTKSALGFKNFILQWIVEDCSLKNKANSIINLKDLSTKIDKIIDSQGEILFDKIPALREIKSRIINLQKNVGRLVQSYMNNPDYKNMFQSDIASHKEGRTVLPIKANFKGKIKGVIHESSSSGATLFLEPMEVVEKNNSIIKAQDEYNREVLRLVRELTQEVRVELENLIELNRVIADIDSFYARARYSCLHKCFPVTMSQGEVLLKEARHPLLKGKVVPIDLGIEKTTRVLIITGPNTGGKTVTLKTLGLLSAMNQFAMELPVQEGCCLPVFDNIFADIGDEQSLEQNLSTYSAHMVNLARIIKSSTARSLILLDELGAGTDPEEGVAVAMALLDHFIEKNCLVLSTTHHGILKNYGYTRENAENASMDFDTNTLSPKYRLLMGVPGESYALTIAQRHGLPEEIVNKAGEYLEDERTDISELLNKLSQKQKELLEAEKEQKTILSELSEKQRRADLKELRLRQQENELRIHGLQDLKHFLSNGRKELSNLIQEIKEKGYSQEQSQKMGDLFRSIEERVEVEETHVKEDIDKMQEDVPHEFCVGMEVLVKKSGQPGEIIRKGKGKSWIVKTNHFKVNLLPQDIEPAYEKSKTKKIDFVGETIQHQRPAYEIDVRGLYLNEALQVLERQIDRAILSSLNEFAVIHGKGDGILQQGVHDYLRKNPYVSDYQFSLPEQGGFGRTLIKLNFNP